MAWGALAVSGGRAALASEPDHAAGKKGHQLQWLPYRPAVPRTDPNVRPTAHVSEAGAASGQRAEPGGALSEVPQTAARPPSVRGPDSPFNDPFGDHDAEEASPDAGSLAQQETQLPPVGPPRSLDSALPPIGDDPLPLGEPSRIEGLSPVRELEPSTDEALPLPRPLKDSASQDDAAVVEPQEAGDVPGSRNREVGDPDEEYVRKRADPVKCISPEDIRPLTEISTDIRPKGELPKECRLSEKRFDLEVPRPWCPIAFTWKAAGTCHKPLYFEQVHLERYGHSWGPYLQPFVSGAHFFLTVPILPYKMGLYPPGECMYTLGYYRPGNCAPYMLDPIPLSVRAGLAQAGAWTGGLYVIP